MKLRHDSGLPVHGVDFETDEDGRVDLTDNPDRAASLLEQSTWHPEDDEARALAEQVRGDKYGRMKKPELVAEAEARGLDPSGKVEEIRERLIAADEEG